MMKRMNAALAMSSEVAERMFPADRLAGLSPAVRLLDEVPMTGFEGTREAQLLADADILVTGWGCPALTEAVLERAPRLRYVVHAAGSVKEHVTRAVWERGIQVSTAAEANAVPVAEYTFAVILLANKNIFELAALLKEQRTAMVPDRIFTGMGNYGKTVGIVGASRIGRHVIRLLRQTELNVVVFDPFLSDDEARQLGVRSVELEELLATADVVSLHAPVLPETRGMIDSRRISLIRPGTVFINTARGALVDQDALRDRLLAGDIFGVLDVTTPWVLAPDDPLYDLPNVLLTPHLAGSMGTELDRLAMTALDEATRVASGEELRYPVSAGDIARIA